MLTNLCLCYCQNNTLTLLNHQFQRSLWSIVITLCSFVFINIMHLSVFYFLTFISQTTESIGTQHGRNTKWSSTFYMSNSMYTYDFCFRKFNIVAWPVICFLIQWLQFLKSSQKQHGWWICYLVAMFLIKCLCFLFRSENQDRCHHRSFNIEAYWNIAKFYYILKPLNHLKANLAEMFLGCPYKMSICMSIRNM